MPDRPPTLLPGGRVLAALTVAGGLVLLGTAVPAVAACTTLPQGRGTLAATGADAVLPLLALALVTAALLARRSRRAATSVLLLLALGLGAAAVAAPPRPALAQECPDTPQPSPATSPGAVRRPRRPTSSGPPSSRSTPPQR